MVQRWPQNGPKMVQRWFQNGPKVVLNGITEHIPSEGSIKSYLKDEVLGMVSLFLASKRSQDGPKAAQMVSKIGVKGIKNQANILLKNRC